VILSQVHKHQPELSRYILASGLLYTFDLLLRIVKTRLTTATLTPLGGTSGSGLVRVELAGLGAGWRAGQHVRLRVLSGRMGALGFGFAEAHPFTVASVPGDGQGLVLLCKRAGGWTGRLWELANQGGGQGEKGMEAATARVLVEGPYGEPPISSLRSRHR
jgi:ferric-chelate reductase